MKYICMLMIVAAGLLSCGRKMTINGTYSTDFGDLQLQEKDKKVTGTYSYPGANGANASGSLTGDLNGTDLSFTWSQTQGTQQVSGTGKFAFSADGNSFTGTWQDQAGNTGAWNGKKK